MALISFLTATWPIAPELQAALRVLSKLQYPEEFSRLNFLQPLHIPVGMMPLAVCMNLENEFVDNHNLFSTPNVGIKAAAVSRRPLNDLLGG